MGLSDTPSSISVNVAFFFFLWVMASDVFCICAVCPPQPQFAQEVHLTRGAFSKILSCLNREVAAFIFIPCHGYLVTSGMAVSWGCQLLHSSWRDLSSGDLCDHGGFFGGFAGHWKISEGLWQVCWTTFLLYILRWPQVPEASNPLDQSNY